MAEELGAISVSGGPLVSAVMIFLDGERFLAEAVESVLAQTYPHWELMLVDDGSTDGSSEIAQSYAALHPARIHYITHPDRANRGMSASRNLGVRHARGGFVAFLDADDVWLPEKLERQVALLTEHPEATIVYGATLLWYSWTGREEDRDRDRLRPLGVAPNTLVPPPALIPVYLRRAGNPPATCGVLVRRRAIDDVGGFEESFRGMFEDQVFFYKLALTYPVFVEGGSWDMYRQHPESHCNVAERSGTYRYNQPNAPELAFLEWLEAYTQHIGSADPLVKRALRQRLRSYRYPRAYRGATALRELITHLARYIRG